MTTFFIADLHLSPNSPTRIQLAIDFLNSKIKKTDSLYILGDLFNTWLGDDIVPSEFAEFISTLHTLSQIGIKTYLMVGNRDFMMGKQFAHSIGAELLSDYCLLDLYGTKTLLMHGDTLCIDDTSYQRYRLWSRNKLLQWCFLHLSANYRQGISDKIKQKSAQQKHYKSTMIMDVNQAEVSRVMKKFNVNQLIHGHTHRPAIHQHDTGSRIVLGDWEDEISYLQCDQQQCQLIDYRVTRN